MNCPPSQLPKERVLNGLSDFVCVNCQPGCLVCSLVNNQEVCSSCAENYQLNGGKCISSQSPTGCANSTFRQNRYFCTACQPGFTFNVQKFTCESQATPCPANQYMQQGGC